MPRMASTEQGNTTSMKFLDWAAGWVVWMFFLWCLDNWELVSHWLVRFFSA